MILPPKRRFHLRKMSILRAEAIAAVAHRAPGVSDAV
jgi:hypothetical protein